MLAQSGDVQSLVPPALKLRQAQKPAEEPGEAACADQHGKAAGVAVTHLGQVDDQPAGAGRSRPRSCSRSAGAQAMSTSPLSSAMVMPPAAGAERARPGAVVVAESVMSLPVRFDAEHDDQRRVRAV